MFWLQTMDAEFAAWQTSAFYRTPAQHNAYYSLANPATTTQAVAHHYHLDHSTHHPSPASTPPLQPSNRQVTLKHARPPKNTFPSTTVPDALTSSPRPQELSSMTGLKLIHSDSKTEHSPAHTIDNRIINPTHQQNPTHTILLTPQQEQVVTKARKNDPLSHTSTPTPLTNTSTPSNPSQDSWASHSTPQQQTPTRQQLRTTSTNLANQQITPFYNSHSTDPTDHLPQLVTTNLATTQNNVASHNTSPSEII